MSLFRSEFDDAYEDEEKVRGAILTTPIRSLELGDYATVSASASVADAVAAMNKLHKGCVLVREGDRLVGIFTERDVLKKVVPSPTPIDTISIREVMTKDPETLTPDDTIAFALNKMSVGGFRHIPLVDKEGRAVGTLSVRDIVSFIVDLFPEGVLNLPPSPNKGIPKSVEGG